MKFACMCAGGNVRSVAMAYALKEKGHDALACGAINSLETREMIFQWADRILVMHQPLLKFVPPQFSNKLILVDVGPDPIGPTYASTHPKTWKKVMEWAESFKRKGTE